MSVTLAEALAMCGQMADQFEDHIKATGDKRGWSRRTVQPQDKSKPSFPAFLLPPVVKDGQVVAAGVACRPTGYSEMIVVDVSKELKAPTATDYGSFHTSPAAAASSAAIVGAFSGCYIPQK